MGRLAASLTRRNVAYIGVTREDKAAGAAREDGFRAGLKSEGRELEDKYVRISAFRAESGYEAALSLLNDEKNIGVISCATDTIAAGAIRALRAQGMDLASGGDDQGIIVTGFGDNQLLKAATGGIPTIHFGYKTSGIRSAELLLDVIERGEKIPIEMKLGFRLIE